MQDLHTLSDLLFTGGASTHDADHHPFASLNRLEELAPGVAFYKDFVNLTGVRTDDGLVLIDTGAFNTFMHQQSFDAMRGFTSERLHSAVYTHAHVDHAYGLPPYLAEAESNGWPEPEIIAHEACPARMQRYIDTAGYNTVINSRQFGAPIEWPTDPNPPTLTYADSLTLEIGNVEIHLHHARGETDDHTWAWLPHARAVCTGDLFIWAAPNAGNPQKVQRYAIEWSRALRQMAALEPELLLPGHGVPVFGAERVGAVLRDTADYLESLYLQTVAAMNEGASVYEVIERVEADAELASRPYLQPVYDEPEFIVRNVYRCLGGWYSGVPSELKPATPRAQAAEICSLAGGIETVVERARSLMEAGDLRLACHLVDWAAAAAPDSHEVHALRAAVYEKRTEAETSTMSRGVFGAAARESHERAKS